MVFDLSKLVEWTRRACGDRPRRVRELIDGDGGAEYVLGNEGSVTLITITLDGNLLDLAADVSVDENILTFANAVDDTTSMVINYSLTRYPTSDVVQFLVDAALSVQADMSLGWAVSKTGRVTTTDAALCTGDGTDILPIFQKLIVYRASLDMYGDKANQAADDAIMVKDGDTTIDTSKTSGSSESAMKRLQTRYEVALREARASRFRGLGMDHSDYTPPSHRHTPGIDFPILDTNAVPSLLHTGI